MYLFQNIYICNNKKEYKIIWIIFGIEDWSLWTDRSKGWDADASKNNSQYLEIHSCSALFSQFTTEANNQRSALDCISPHNILIIILSHSTYSSWYWKQHRTGRHLSLYWVCPVFLNIDRLQTLVLIQKILWNIFNYYMLQIVQMSNLFLALAALSFLQSSDEHSF